MDVPDERRAGARRNDNESGTERKKPNKTGTVVSGSGKDLLRRFKASAFIL